MQFGDQPPGENLSQISVCRFWIRSKTGESSKVKVKKTFAVTKEEFPHMKALFMSLEDISNVMSCSLQEVGVSLGY